MARRPDPHWPQECVDEAAADGWQLAYTVDSGKDHAYYRVYPVGPKLTTPTAAAQHVLKQANKGGSKLCVRALQLMAQSSMPVQKVRRPK